MILFAPPGVVEDEAESRHGVPATGDDAIRKRPILPSPHVDRPNGSATDFMQGEVVYIK